MVTSDIGREAAQQAVVNQIAAGLNLEEGPDGDEVTMTSNTDRTETVYSMIDGAPKPILANDLQRVLLKKLPDGRSAHWIEGMPGPRPPEYEIGNLKCFLYPEYEDEGRGFDRAFVDSLGLAGRTCNMNNTLAKNRADFRTQFQREDHEKSKHREEKAALDLGLARREREQERLERQQDREAMLALAARSAGPVASEPAFPCDECSESFDSEQGRRIHKGMAHKEADA